MFMSSSVKCFDTSYSPNEVGEMVETPDCFACYDSGYIQSDVFCDCEAGIVENEIYSDVMRDKYSNC